MTLHFTIIHSLTTASYIHVVQIDSQSILSVVSLEISTNI